jgi:hypothetical protein
MASLTPIYLWRGGGDFGLRERLVRVNNADQNDTTTISELDVIIDTVGINAVDGAALTCTEATNVVTITSAITDKDCLILVSGS